MSASVSAPAGERADARTASSRTAPSSTPTVRRALSRSRFWLIAAAGVVVIAGLSVLFAGGLGSTGTPLGASEPGPAGSQALVEVLRQRGVEVVEAAGYEDAAAAASAGTTLLVYDPEQYLDAGRITALAAQTEHLVLVNPGFGYLQALTPQTGFGGVSDDELLDAQCRLPAAQKAESIRVRGSDASGEDSSYRTDDPGAVECFPGGPGTFSLLQLPTAAGDLTILGSTRVLSNDGIADAGNAALALNLLGGTQTLVWYLPAITDVAATGDPSLGELTPGWVTPVLALAGIVAIAAAIWRGRRLGPLVIENLPVTVRARETMEGRARLYARSSSRLRALDALRIGALGRLGGLLGLPPSASAEEVSDASAALTGRHPAEVRELLLDGVPAGDAALLDYSGRLAELETAVRRAIDQTGRMDV
ncbi:DUF4350 domain-containing protein [Compostimonas suwonensis]|uniref:Uncharacterized protein DUF4350 n=1 Tax=Compostimonas suwonensis TaxID=1048394 RepID=A0A2M9BUU6_9MICO|nr:DUF4350 domain-containing protein [Compostimonas suwonensis]PJJ61690.1 uncharacterized protein DUF4350 [Compostimonas suwonensis]